ncbi:hypothetical protein LINPERPRIM_LOCUS28199 [Linum perenne]
MVANYHLGPWGFLLLVKQYSFFFQANPLIHMPSSRLGFKSMYIYPFH